jgi:NAD(P)-dependent dehydrogenase (short-subunit alcohol dehydrogenase family)
MTLVNPSLPLAGRAYLVTGGGSGIGLACATRLVADGAAVTICGRSVGRLEDAVRKILADATPGGDVRSVSADITVEADVQRAVAAAMEATGRLDGCIANAGGGGMPAPYHVQDPAEFLRVLQLNVLGTMLCIKHTVGPMIAAGGGSFVGMSSVAGVLSHPYFGAYPVAKAGIEAMMRNAADEYGRFKLRFNAIRPGFISTEIMDGIPRDSEAYRSYLDNTPMAGVGQPEDVAHLARFLLGDEARWITGQCIGVDGGHSLRRGPDFTATVAMIHGQDVLQGP